MSTGSAIRVLHLTSSFPRWAGDHQAPFMADLAAAQKAAGMEPAVLSPHGPGLSAREVIGGVPVRRFRYAPSRFERLAYRGGLLSTVRSPLGAAALPGFLGAFALAAGRMVRSHRAEVVHAHWWAPAGLTGVLAAGTAGVPLVVTCHGTDVELIGGAGLGRLATAVLRRAAVIGAVSVPLAERVEQLTGLPVRVLRMPLVLEPVEVTPPPVPPPLRLVAVGRLSREKGFDVAVAAVARLVAEGCDVHLRLIGDGPERGSLEAAASAVPGRRVVLEGPVSRPDLAVAIGSSHAVLVPSRHEGLGLVAVEALGRGRPVIASAVGGLVEAVSVPDDGILVPPEDPAALAAAIRRLPLPAPTGASVGGNDPGAVAAAHRRAYEEAIGGRAPRDRGRPAP